jgi:DNA-binding protein
MSSAMLSIENPTIILKAKGEDIFSLTFSLFDNKLPKYTDVKEIKRTTNICRIEGNTFPMLSGIRIAIAKKNE